MSGNMMPTAGGSEISGYCPMGCGSTLCVEGSRIVCWNSGCPDLLAAQKILMDFEIKHVVRFGGGGFTVRHPLRERLDDALMTCDLHLACIALPGPPEGRPGTFRAFERDGRWVFQREAWQERQGDAS